MPDYIFPLLGHIIYFGFLVWLVFATFMNFLLKPVFAMRENKNYKIDTAWVWAYVVAWTLVLIIPTIPALVQGA